MVETRRSSNRLCASSSSTTPEASSSQRPSKRSKVKFNAASGSSLEPVAVEPTGSSSGSEIPKENQEQASESGEPELGSSDPQDMDAKKPVTTNVPVTVKKKDSNAPWAKLISQNRENPHRIIRDRMFTVGRRGELPIKENSMPTTLCTLEQNERRLSQARLKTVGNGVYINGYECEKGINLQIYGGDELTFGYSGKHSYIYQPLPFGTLDVSERASLLIPHARASLSKCRNYHLVPPIDKAANRQQNPEVPAVASSCNDCILDTDMNDPDTKNDQADISPVEKNAPSPFLFG